MALQVGRALGRGSRRALNTTGIVLVILHVVYTVVLVGSMNIMVAELLPPAVRQQAEFGITFPISSSFAGVLVGIDIVFGVVLVVATTRALTRELPCVSTLSADLFTRRIDRAVVSALAASVVVMVSVMVGFVLLVVPGFFFAVSFAFVTFAIGVEDARAIPALRRSWALARGNRWRLFGLVFIVGLVTGAAGTLGSIVSIADPVVGQAVSLTGTSAFSVLSYGILADAFVQLRAGLTGDA